MRTLRWRASTAVEPLSADAAAPSPRRKAQRAAHSLPVASSRPASSRPATTLTDERRRFQALVRADGTLTLGPIDRLDPQDRRARAGPARLQRLDVLAHDDRGRRAEAPIDGSRLLTKTIRRLALQLRGGLRRPPADRVRWPVLPSARARPPCASGVGSASPPPARASGTQRQPRRRPVRAGSTARSTVSSQREMREDVLARCRAGAARRPSMGASSSAVAGVEVGAQALLGTSVMPPSRPFAGACAAG